MDKWDGKEFINLLNLDAYKTVLEIGCGTGRIAKKIIKQCKKYVGIDISSKTVDVARNHFKDFNNASFINEDFLKYKDTEKYDVIFSTLTFMHIKDKEKALINVFNLLKNNGIFVLSVDKNQQNFIDTGYSRIEGDINRKNGARALLRESIGLFFVCLSVCFSHSAVDKRGVT